MSDRAIENRVINQFLIKQFGDEIKSSVPKEANKLEMIFMQRI